MSLCVMLVAVVLAGLAGAGRDRAQPKGTGRFLADLLMALVAGVFSAGMGLSFVYGQGPIMEAMRREGASELCATFGVWAVALLGGALVNVLYPLWLMRRNRSWRAITESSREFLLAVLIGINAAAAVVLLGLGMRMLGALGASVGLGLQSASWMLGGQAVGFVSGEWRGIAGAPRKNMYWAVTCLLAAVLLMVRGNFLENSRPAARSARSHAEPVRSLTGANGGSAQAEPVAL